MKQAEPIEVAPCAADSGESWEDEVRLHREVWQRKPILRQVYRRWYETIRRSCVPGKTLEIGGGCGNFKEYWPELVSCDVVDAPWLDFQADCMALPVEDGTYDNIVGVDVLHHLYDPDAALRELARCVRVGGRLVFVEPYVSWFSRGVRARFHTEKQDLTRDVIYDSEKKPEEANLAIPTRIFVRSRSEFEGRFPLLRIVRVRFSDMFAYPLSGGFRRGSLLPQRVLRVVDRLEPVVGFLARWLGFKMLIVLEVRKP